MTDEKHNKPLIIGLTGSIAMGKSTVAAMFEAEGVPVFDADAAVHILQGPGGDLLPEIEELFPNTTNENGVDRPALGAAVFGKPDELKKLEAIIHPAVGQMRQRFLAEHAAEPFIVFDIPLLFEKGGAEHVDHIVVVSAPDENQRARALSRPNMTVEKFDAILALQLPDMEKRNRADTVIDTGVDLETTRAAVQQLIRNLKAN